MRVSAPLAAVTTMLAVWAGSATLITAQQPPASALPAVAPTPVPAVATLVARLDLERYKATIKGLTQFGDRRQGTERNRRAVDWIEARLRSYGCPTERLTYVYDP